MTAANQTTLIAHLFKQGLREHEICQKARASPIFTRHAIARICCDRPSIESLHYQNRKKGIHKARIINNDPHWEEVDRFV